jgi:hypothetical protein
LAEGQHHKGLAVSLSAVIALEAIVAVFALLRAVPFVVVLSRFVSEIIGIVNGQGGMALAIGWGVLGVSIGVWGP